jgi:hypothetical protein
MGNSYQIFNGASNYAGYIQSWKGGRSAIRIIRAADNTESAINTAFDALIAKSNKVTEIEKGINDGFMVNSYQIGFQRTVQNQYFLNVEGAVAILGRGQGQITLSGLVGKADALAKLLGSTEKTTGTLKDDFCTPLCIMVSGTTQMNECPKKSDINSGAVFLCGNVVVQSFTITGQTQADGAEIQSANIVGTFTRLNMKNGSANADSGDDISPFAAGTGRASEYKE